LDIERIVAELKKERDRLDQAIAALDGLSATRRTTVASNRVAPIKKKGGGLTPEGRKRLSEMMKKRWAERRKKSSKGRK
jgi:Spy/CpxP family protein refolding chaperone